MSGTSVTKGFLVTTVFCAVIVGGGAVEATDCQDPAVGWREDCRSSDTGCEGGFRARYHTYEDTATYLRSLNLEFDDADHMSIIELGDWGWPDGAMVVWYPTYLVRVAEHASALDVEHPPILFVASLHAHEWIASEVALGYVDYLVKGASSGDAAIVGPDGLLEKAEFWFVVHGNVSGRIYDDIVDTDCGATVCQPGNPDHKLNGQRKSRQWVFGAEEDAEDYSDDADYSGYCDFESTGVLSLGDYGISAEVEEWKERGINVENDFSAVWPGRLSEPYGRTAMLANLASAYHPKLSDYAGAFRGEDGDGNRIYETAPEMFGCQPTVADSCSSKFPDHPHCLRKGGSGVDPLFGCFMVDAAVAYDRDSAGSCEAFGDTHEALVTDELGIRHVCLRTTIDLGFNPIDPSDDDNDYLFWECGMSGAPLQSGGPYPAPVVVPGVPLAVCEDGVLSSCRDDGDCTAIPNADFSDKSVHRFGQRYCQGSSGFCAVSKHHTPCSDAYRGQRPFESVEARLIRTVADNIPFSFVVDMHASANTMSGTCRNMAGGCCSRVDTDHGCAGRNEDYDRVDALTRAMVDEYNTAAGADWGGDLPSFLEMHFDRIDMTLDEDGDPQSAGSQTPVWMSNSPAVSDHREDEAVTSQNFDNGTHRGVTSFIWELGVPTEDGWDALTDAGDKTLYAKLMKCTSETSKYPSGGNAPRSSRILGNQLAGMKGVVEYLAGQAETPNLTADPDVAVPPALARRDVSLGGLRIHDGHGRGVQQIETRVGRIESDPAASTVIPAGTWAVEVDALGGSDSTAVATLSGEVTLLSRKLFAGPYSFSGGVSEVESVTIGRGERSKVTRRFRFEPSQHRVTAKVEGGNACGALPAPEVCAAANDRLVAKVKAVACDDVDAIPNGFDPEAFCQQGLPFDDPDFRCNTWTGRCEECWRGWNGDDQGCEEGGFCFEGMCDDSATCWSGAIADEYEASNGGGESSPTISGGGPPIVRSLHLGSGNVQDVDSFFVTVSSGSVAPTMYGLHLDVRNLCEDDVDASGWHFPLEGYMQELEVRVQAPTLLTLIGGAVYRNLTAPSDDGWTPIDRVAGLAVPISISDSATLNDGGALRIQVRNVEPYGEHAISYSLDAEVSDNGLAPIDSDVKVRPDQEVIGPTEAVGVDVSPGELVSIAPTNDAIEDGYMVFFKPAAGYEEMVLKGEVQLLLVTPDGRVPTSDNGAPLAATVERDGGLAIPLSALLPEMGPYEVRLGTVSGRVEGSVYLCSPNVDSCSTFDPRTSTCGSACTGDGYRCCADQDRNYTCANLKGSDVLNCGACGNACDWDEKCLKGVCVKGKATSCWNTTCPEDTECVSKDFLFLRNPQCRATLVDRTWCGWFGTVCGSTQDCVLGLCLPKMNVACGLKCVGEGQSCCWVNGVEQCVDVASSWARCGSCGNACDVDELCSGGKCEPWYTVAKVCPGEGGVNCSRTWISCKNVLNDAENCGECGLRCPDGGWCEAGQCLVRVKDDVANEH